MVISKDKPSNAELPLVGFTYFRYHL